MRDWGERSPRWAGVRSETVDVCGTSVHLLRADGARPGRQARADRPTLPGPLGTAERVVWQMLGRTALFAGSAFLRGSSARSGPRWWARSEVRRDGSTSQAATCPGSHRNSPALVDERLDALGQRPERLRDGIVAFASAVAAMYVDQRPALDAIDRVTAPTLLLWGDQDPLIERQARPPGTGLPRTCAARGR